MFGVGKLLWLFAQPLSLTFLLLVVALLLTMTGWRKLGFLSLFVAAGLLFVTLFTSLGAWSLQILEARYPRPTPPETVSCMIVLGGAFDLEVTAGRGGMEFNQSADRFIEAARLARLYPEARVLVSGGDGSFSGHYAGDAELAGPFFTAMGLDPARIIREVNSRNTAENVLETRKLLDANALSGCLLITSAYHLPRATALFAAEGVTVIPWASDYRASGKVELGFDFTQPTLNSQLTSTAAREWAALAAAHLAGQSPTWVP